MSRPGDKWYSDQERAEALAMIETEGVTGAEVSRRTGIPRATVSRWAAEYNEVSAEQQPELMNRMMRRALKTDDLIDRALEHLKDQPDADLVKVMDKLNFTGGTAVDKIQRSQEKGINTHGPTIIFNVGSTKDAVDIARQTTENTQHE